MKHCSDCVTELQPDKKRLGKFSNWITCPSCGFRTRPDSETGNEHIIKINTIENIYNEEQ